MLTRIFANRPAAIAWALLLLDAFLKWLQFSRGRFVLNDGLIGGWNSAMVSAIKPLLLVELVMFFVSAFFFALQTFKDFSSIIASLTVVLAGFCSNALDHLFFGGTVDYLFLPLGELRVAFNLSDLVQITGFVFVLRTMLLHRSGIQSDLRTSAAPFPEINRFILTRLLAVVSIIGGLSLLTGYLFARAPASGFQMALIASFHVVNSCILASLAYREFISRVLGPLVRMQRTLRLYNQTGQTESIRLRKHDFFGELCSEINRAIDKKEGVDRLSP